MSRRSKHIPERTCILCGRKAPKTELERLVVRREGEGWIVVADRRQTLAGRGAYVCRRGDCLDRALQDTDRFKAHIERAFRKRLKNLDFRGLREGNGKDKSA